MFPRNGNRNQGYIRMFPRNENRNEGTFACSPGTKTGTRAHSPKPPFYETALLSPLDSSAARRLVLSIHIFTWQSLANPSLIHSIHANTFTPLTRIVATKLRRLKVRPMSSAQVRANLAHQNRTIAIASDFRADGAKSPEIPQNEGGFGLRNHSPESQIASDFPSHP